MTQQLNEHRLQVEQQLSAIRRENQELSTKVRSEAKEEMCIRDSLKSVSFNGEGEYPMEFIKELEEIRKEYYANEGVFPVSYTHLDVYKRQFL